MPIDSADYERFKMIFLFYRKLTCLDFTGVSLFRVRCSYFDSATFSFKLKHTFCLSESASFQGEKIPVCVLFINRNVWR